MDELSLGPELGGLLAELAWRPERAALGAHVRRFQELLVPDSLRIEPLTGMGALEAHLLRVHRAELAHLLLQASQIRLAEEDHPVLRPRDEHGRVRTVHGQRWRRRARAEAQGRFGAAEPVGPMELLSRALSGDRAARPTAREFAIASLRLVPATATTIWVGVHCGLEGELRRGIELQRNALAGNPSALLAAYAWSNIAGMSTELQRYQDALEAGRSATLVAPAWSRGAVEWLVSAAQGGHAREVLQAGRVVGDILAEDSEELSERMQFMQQRRLRGAWRPTRQGRELALHLGSRLPAAAERTLEVLL